MVWLWSANDVQSDQIENLEKERSWKEEEFDFILQFLRTILLKRKFRRFYFAIQLMKI